MATPSFDPTKMALKTKASVIANRLVHTSPHTFRGRLGYACINTLLRKQNPPVFCSRTCRLATAQQKGIDYVKELGLQNLNDLKALIEWNEAHHIRFMRMSSDIFPFASHDAIGYSLEFAKEELASVGKLAAKYNHRLTAHPGQYNQLGSPNPQVVARTVKDLEYHASMMDYMQLPADSVMIIHMGGVYNDKAATLARFKENYAALSDSIKRRLVLENDEIGYSVSDLLPICRDLNIPLVLDWHHHSINPGDTDDLLALIPAINATWHRKGMKPKQHYSESRPGAVSVMERRAHSDRVQTLPPSGDDVDLMIEAKDKEQAVLALYKKYGLAPVDDTVWIPSSETKTKSKVNKTIKKAVVVKKQDHVKEQVYQDGMRTRSKRLCTTTIEKQTEIEIKKAKRRHSNR